MEIDLELPSSREKRLNDDDDGRGNGVDNEILVCGDGVNLNVNRSRVESLMPHNGIEFETKEVAYSFYRDYAWKVGFGITIKSSRRSKRSGKFIDIKIACSRFGCRPSTSQSNCTKTDCKASMHIKKRPEGKWFIFNFVEEHNHEVFPDEFYNTSRGRKNQEVNAVSQMKGLQLVLDERDVELLLDYLMHMQSEAPGFYYAIDFDAGPRMRNVFWVDPKARHDYVPFSDVVFFDTYNIRNKYKIPFVPIVGVNNHFQFVLLGCALIGDETKSTFTWLMHTWLRAVAGHSPKVVITDNIKSLTEATHDVFPNASHCFCPWHVFAEVGPNLSHKFKEPDLFFMKLKKCTCRAWTIEEFDKRWHKMVKQFDLADDKWMQSLYEDRCQWVPSYMKEVFLGGFCTVERSQSIVSFFDKYMRRGTTFSEFINQYKLFLHELSEEEVKAEVETRSSGLKIVSQSPFEKQMSKIYTNAVLKKFQSEVSGMLSCTLEKVGEDEENIIYNVVDLERKQIFTVYLNKEKYDVYCSCRLFEHIGFLCRHALSGLQLSGISTIPPNYILKRWTRTAKMINITPQESVTTNFRVQRLNDICKLAIKLGMEGSLSGEAYKVAYHALEEATDHCACLNYSVVETNKTAGHSLSDAGQKNDKSIAKISKMKVSKKQKVRAEPEKLSTGIGESSQDVEQLNVRSHRLLDSYIPQEDLQGTEAGMRIPSSYGAEHGSQGLGHLKSLSSLQDCFYNDHPLMQGVLLQGQFSFRPSSLEGCFQVRESLHNVQENSAYMMSKHLPD